MDYRYSDFTVEQLREEIGKLKEKAQKAEQLGNVSEVSINEWNMQVAISYMLNAYDYDSKSTYEMNNDLWKRFKINYINGVFSWGHRINLLDEVYEKEEAVPISLLGYEI